MSQVSVKRRSWERLSNMFSGRAHPRVSGPQSFRSGRSWRWGQRDGETEAERVGGWGGQGQDEDANLSKDGEDDREHEAGQDDETA